MQLKAFLFILIIPLFASCRKNNQKVFEKFTDIQIPISAIVTKDEYQDMRQDYVKIFEIQLDKKSIGNLTQSISKSKYFDTSVYSDNNISSNRQLTIDNTKGIWYRNKNGYAFYGSTNNNRDIVFAVVDTLVLKAKFKYLSD